MSEPIIEMTEEIQTTVDETKGSADSSDEIDAELSRLEQSAIGSDDDRDDEETNVHQLLPQTECDEPIEPAPTVKSSGKQKPKVEMIGACEL